MSFFFLIVVAVIVVVVGGAILRKLGPPLLLFILILTLLFMTMGPKSLGKSAGHLARGAVTLARQTGGSFINEIEKGMGR